MGIQAGETSVSISVRVLNRVFLFDEHVRLMITPRGLLAYPVVKLASDLACLNQLILHLYTWA